LVDLVMTIIVGIDTEYVREGENGDELPDEIPGNYVLSYQAWILDTETGKQDGAIIHTCGPDKRFRLSFTGFLSRALHASLKAGVIDEIPERIIVAVHFARADICGFADWTKFKRQIDAVRGTYATTKKPMVRHLRINNRPQRISITLIDTMLLAPAGQRSLSALGDMLGVAKIDLPDGVVERMDLFRDTDPVLFGRYALRDAEITALWFEKVLQFFDEDLGIYGSRVPATLGAAGVRMFKQNAGGGSAVNRLLGMERIKNGKNWVRVPVPTIADHYSFFADCYHGARNEAYTAGYSDVGDIIDVDLAGAYTTAMAGIRTPAWEATVATTDIAVLANVSALSVARVQFQFPKGTRFPSLPVRAGERGLVYPLSGMSYCTGAELVVALEQGADVTVEHGVFVPFADDVRPYANFTKTINGIRTAHPKGNLFERMAKEIGNSLYGKTAQGVETMKARSDKVQGRRVFSTETGGMMTLPPSAISQPLLAAFTTGLVRAVLSEAISRLPDDRVVYSATTDGFLTNAGPGEIDLSGPACTLFAELRRTVSNDPNIIEVKHRVGQVIVTKTRGTITTRPANENDPGQPVLARAGQRLGTQYADPWVECRAWENEVKTRTFDTVSSHQQFIPLRRQWLYDTDLIALMRTCRMNLCYDLKRRPQNVRDVGSIIAFETVPWADINEFSEYRDALDQWRTDKRRVLKTALDWQEFVTWKDAQPGRRLAGVRGGRPRIVTLFMRAYARGELGLPGKDYTAAAAFVTMAGWPTTADNIKDAKRRGPLHFNAIEEFDPTELEFVAKVSQRWPGSRLCELLK
jgi:hypothetical protein